MKYVLNYQARYELEAQTPVEAFSRATLPNVYPIQEEWQITLKENDDKE
jgi:hypothetical protein